jgi:hypothetical protein
MWLHLSSPVRYALLVLLLVGVALLQLRVHPTVTPDLRYQIASAQALAHGEGYVTWLLADGDLSKPAPQPNAFWPVGYSLILSVALALGLSLEWAEPLVRALGILLALAAWLRLLALLRPTLPPYTTTLVLLYASLVFNPLWIASPSEVYLIVALSWATVAGAQWALHPASSTRWRWALAAGLLLSVSVWFKHVGYALLPLPVVLWGWAVWRKWLPLREWPQLVLSTLGMLIGVGAIQLYDLWRGAAGGYAESAFAGTVDPCYSFLFSAVSPARVLSVFAFSRLTTFSPVFSTLIGWMLAAGLGLVLLRVAFRPQRSTPSALPVLSAAALVTTLSTFAVLAYLAIRYCYQQVAGTYLSNLTYYYPTFLLVLLALCAWAAEAWQRGHRWFRLAGVVLAIFLGLLAVLNLRVWARAILSPPTDSSSASILHQPLYRELLRLHPARAEAGFHSHPTVIARSDFYELGHAALAGYTVFRGPIEQLKISNADMAYSQEFTLVTNADDAAADSLLLTRHLAQLGYVARVRPLSAVEQHRIYSVSPHPAAPH